MKKKDSTQTALGPDAPRLYDSKEAAELLKCSVVTLRNYVRAGQLHPQRVGTRYLFTEADLLRLVQCGTDSRYSAFIKARREGRRLTPDALEEEAAPTRARRKGPDIDLDLANRVMQAAKCAAGPEEFLAVLKELLGAE